MPRARSRDLAATASLAAVALLVAAPAEAHAFKLQDLVRKLTHEEAQRFKKPLVQVVETLRSGLAAQEVSCDVSEWSAPGGEIEAPKIGVVMPEGISPRIWGTSLFCGKPEHADHVKVELALDAEEGARLLKEGELLEQKGRASLRRIRWRGDDPPVALVITGQGRGITPVLSIRFHHGSRYRALAGLLDVSAFQAALQGLEPLPKASASSVPEASGPESFQREQAEREVVEGVVTAVFGARPLLVVSPPRAIRIEIPRKARGKILQSAPDLRETLLADFQRVLASGGQPSLPAKAVTIPDAESDKLFEENVAQGWKTFRGKYPGAPGILTFSRVGFSKDRMQAMLYVGWQEDALVGQGTVYVLGRGENGEWTVLYESVLWYS